MFTRFLRVRFFVMFALALVLAAGAYGFAASNTVPASYAGDGSNTISGYVISTVHYNLNAANPGTIDSVTFTTDVAPAAGSTIKIQLVAAGTVYSCTAAGTAVTCDNGSTLGASVTSATQLRVVIAD